MKKIMMLVIGCTFILSACGNEKNINLEVPGFASFTSHMMMDDGWYMTIEIVVDKKDIQLEEIDNNIDTSTLVVFFDGVNVKHKSIEGFYAPLLHEGKEIDKSSATIPAFVLNSEYREECSRISEHLTALKKFSAITEADLADLQITMFDKADIVTLYNKAIQSRLKWGKYNIPEANNNQIKLANNDLLQVAYFAEYANIGVVNIEYIYADGTYLSDKIMNKTAIGDEIKLQETLDAIEKNMMDTQEVTIVKYKEQFADQTLFDVLQTLIQKTFLPNENE